jgi:putative transcriptional regulator
MDKKLFGELVASMKEMNEIIAGKKKPSRVREVLPSGVKALRARVGLSQPKFASLLGIQVGTLRNWEQGIRKPTGPAKALLTAIGRDPVNVIKALSP